MFCPICKDEFRPGFTRCASCDVTLIDSLEGAMDDGPAGPRSRPAPAVQLYVPMAEYCGFLGLEEARDARDRLKQERIRSEIVIRESPGSLNADVVEEEYWLRVERDRRKDAVKHLGFDTVESGAPDETFSCGECGAEVLSEASACPKCGVRFEDD
jgi:hypothetical protein